MHEYARSGRDPHSVPGPVHEDRVKTGVKLQENVQDILKDGRAQAKKVNNTRFFINAAKKHRVINYIGKPY